MTIPTSHKGPEMPPVTMIDGDLRDFLRDSIADIRATLRTAVGEDGNGGRLQELRVEIKEEREKVEERAAKDKKELDERITTLEMESERRKGARWLAGLIWGGVTFLGALAIDWLHKR